MNVFHMLLQTNSYVGHETIEGRFHQNRPRHLFTKMVKVRDTVLKNSPQQCFEKRPKSQGNHQNPGCVLSRLKLSNTEEGNSKSKRHEIKPQVNLQIITILILV